MALSPEESRKQDQVAPTLMLFAVVLLASWMGAAQGGYFVGEWALTVLILAMLALVASVTGMFRRPNSWWSTIALGLFAAYTAWTFASLLWSPNQGDAWLGAGQTLLYLLAFWLAVGLVSAGASRHWALAASVGGPAIIATVTMVKLIPLIQDFFNNGEGFLLGTVGYQNGEAAFLLIPFWVAIYLAGSRRTDPVLRGLALAGATLSAELSVLTQSRGAIVAIGISLPVFFLISGQRLRGLFAFVPIALALSIAFPDLNGVYQAFANGESAEAAIEAALPAMWLTTAAVALYGLTWGLIDGLWHPPESVTRAIRGVALAGTIAAFIFGALAVSESVGNPITWTEQRWETFKTQDPLGPIEQQDNRYLSASSSGRYTVWQVAWEDFASHPFLGVGTQNFEATYYQLHEGDVVRWLRQPHNLPLEVLSERGLVGGVLFFGFLLACLGTGLWRRFTHLGSEGKAQVGAMSAAVTYWFVHSSVEWFWQLPAVTLPAVLYLAMLVAPWKRCDSVPLRWPLRAAGAGVALFAIAAVAPLYIADRYLAQSETSTDLEEALVAVERAQRFNPVSPEVPEREAELAMQIGDWSRVEEAYRTAMRLNPEHFAPHFLLAESYEQRGELAAALSSYEDALTLNPFDIDLNQRTIELLAQVPGEQSVPVRFMGGRTELGRLSLTLIDSAPPPHDNTLKRPATLSPAAGALLVRSATSGTPLRLTGATTPSDVALIDTRGKVTEIRSMIQPNEIIRPKQSYRLAIAADWGFFEAKDIYPGSRVVFSDTS